MALSKLKGYVSPALLVIGLGFILGLLVSHWQDLINHLNNLKPTWFLSSLILFGISQLCLAGLFAALVSSYQLAISKRRAVSWYFLSQITKYIPGKIWSFLFQIAQVNRRNDAVNVVVLNIEFTLMSITQVTSLALVLLLWNNYPWLAIGVGALGVTTLFIQCLVPLTRFIPAKLIEVLGAEKQHERLESLPVSVVIIAWLGVMVFALAQAFMVKAFFSVPIYDAVTLVGFLLGAWVVGVIALVVPAGVGVREGAFILMASIEGQFATEMLIAVALIGRLWQVIGDLLVSSLAWLVLGERNQNSS